MRSLEIRSTSSGAASAVRTSRSSPSVAITRSLQFAVCSLQFVVCSSWPAVYSSLMKTVAVIGASSNRDKFGNKALRAFANKGYTVYPINPTEAEVEGHKAYASVLDVPGPIDMATIYVPAPVGVAVMGDLVKKGI